MDLPPLSKATSATVQLLPQLAASGQQVVIVVVKQRFHVRHRGLVEREDGAEVRLTDVPWDEDDLESSSNRLPSDLCLHKPSTDVVVSGWAVARGRPRVEQLDVTVAVASIRKVLRVFGTRVWFKGVTGMTLSAPRAFEELPLRWDYAWGGRDDSDPEKPLEEARNPVGRGVTRDPEKLVQKPGPNIEDPGDLISTHRTRPKPAGVGPIGRHWMPRRKYAGTYDEKWKKERMPLPPEDFDDRFNHVAPPDQITPDYLRGGEPVLLENVSEEGTMKFALPRLAFFVGARVEGKVVEHRPAMDTVVFLTKERAFEMTWRSVVPVPRRLGVLEGIQVHEKRVL